MRQTACTYDVLTLPAVQIYSASAHGRADKQLMQSSPRGRAPGGSRGYYLKHVVTERNAVNGSSVSGPGCV